MLIVSLLFAAVLLAFANAATFRFGNCGAALGVAVLGVCGGGMMAACVLWLPGFVLSGVLVAVAAIVCNLANFRPKAFLISSVVATLGVHFGIGWSHYRFLQEYVNCTPVIEIADRLAYEQNPTAAVVLANARPQASSPLVVSLEGEWPKQDRFGRHALRLEMLKEIHADTVDKFVESPGFGVGRRIFRPAMSTVEIPMISSIPQPSCVIDFVTSPPESRATLLSPSSEGPKPSGAIHRNKQYLEFHTNSVASFVNALGFGYLKDRGMVAGFQEHHFQDVPGTSDSNLIEPWRVRRVELVSLLKHAEPCVYLSDNLPRMDELRAAKVRMLDDFEARRLPEILGGEDLVFETSEKSVRLLGAIRAAKACLDCHSVERGALLGAFSYQLGR